MMILRKYVWQFFRWYFIGYLIGMGIIFLLDNLLNLNLHDLPIVFALSVMLPYYITNKFAKNQGRSFHDDELRTMIKRTTLVAWLVSMTLNSLYLGYCIALKLFLSAQEIAELFIVNNIPANSHMSTLVKLPVQYLLAILIGSSIVYYLLIYSFIRRNFKKAVIKSNKMLSGNTDLAV